MIKPTTTNGIVPASQYKRWLEWKASEIEFERGNEQETKALLAEAEQIAESGQDYWPMF